MVEGEAVHNFLHKLLDEDKHLEGDPDYDHKTLYIPKEQII